MIKKIILGVVCVIILAIGGIIAYVMTLDWNEHKMSLAEGISNLIGEKVEFSGNLNVSLLPMPHMYAEDIQIINPETSEKLATIEKLSTSVSLMSVLKKVPNIQTLEVDGMEMWVKVQKDGSTNWNLSRKPDFLNESSGGELQSFSLQNSKVHLEDKIHELTFNLENLTADIQAYSLKGPYRFDGNFTMEEEPFAMSVGLGSISKEEDMSLSANITHPKSKSFLRYDGTWNVQNKQFQGVISGSSEKTASFLNVLTRKKLLDEDYDVPLNFSGNMDKTEDYLDLQALVIKFENLLNGSGNIHIPFAAAQKGEKPEATVKYQMVDLDVRPFINMVKNQSVEYRDGKEYLPDTKMNVSFDLSAVHLIVSDETGGYFESTSARGSWKDNALNLDEFFAACPGNITLQLEGSLLEENKKPQYYAKVSIDGQNFLSWLNAVGIGLTAPVQSSYRNPKLNFIISGDSQAAKFQNITLEMDKMTLKSEVSIFFNDNLYQIDVSADKINLDNYVKVSDDVNKESLNTRIGSMLKKLGDNTVQLNMQAESLVVQGVTSDNFVINALAGKDLLNIQKLQTEGYLDSDIKLSGNFSGFSTDTVNFDNVDVHISSNDVMALAGNLQIDVPKLELYNQKKVDFSSVFSGQENNLTIDTKVSIEGTNFAYNGKMTNYASSESVGFDGNVSFKTMNFPKFLKDIDAGSENFLSSIRVVNGGAVINGTKNNMNFKQFDVLMGKAKYSGSGALQKANGKYSVKGNVAVNEFHLGNFVLTEGNTAPTQAPDNKDSVEFLNKPFFNQDIIDYKAYENIDFDVDFTADRVLYADNRFEKVQAHVINKGNILYISDIACVYEGAIVKGNLNIDYQSDPSVNGDLEFSNIMVTALGGTIYVLDVDNLHAIVIFKAPANSVAQAIYGMNGEVMLDAKKVIVRGIDLHAIAEDLRVREYSKGIFQAVRDSLVKGNTSFDTLKGKLMIASGVFGFDRIELQNAEENVVLTGNFVPEEWKTKADFSVTYKDLPNIPTYSFSFAGVLNKPILDIDISNVAKKYDVHWENLEKEELNKKLAEQEALSEKMSTAQESIAPLEKTISDIRQKIERYREKSNIQANIGQYDKKEAELDAIDKDLYDMTSLGNQSNFTEADIASVEKKCKEYQETLRAFPQALDDLYAQDVKERSDVAWKEVQRIYDESKKLFDEYQKMIQDDFNVLLEIDASQYMVNNADLKTDQAKIVNLSDEMVDLRDEAQSFRTAAGFFTQAEEHESCILDLKQSASKMKNILSQMRKVRKKSADMLLKIIDERRIVYQREEERKAEVQIELKKKEAQARKELQDVDLMVTYREQLTDAEQMASEDDTDKTKNDGKPVIKGGIRTKYDEQMSGASSTRKNSQNPVLIEIKDDQIKGSGVSGSIRKSYNDASQTNRDGGSGVLKQIDGDIQKASGTIKVK